MTLTEFLLARIDEDEKQARDHMRHGVDTYAAVTGPESDEMFSGWEDYYPEKRLAECQAKRQVVNLTAESVEIEVQDDWEHGYSPETRHEWTNEPYVGEKILRALALPYAKHPDFQFTWLVS